MLNATIIKEDKRGFLQNFKTEDDFIAASKEEHSQTKRRDFIKNPSFFICPPNLSPQEHSRAIDSILKCHTLEIENELTALAKKRFSGGDVKSWGKKMHGGSQTWVGLDPQVLNTPYSELKEMIDFINPKEHDRFIDLGAGYGRMGVILSSYNLKLHFHGHELVKERVDEAKRWLQDLHCENCEMTLTDLGDENFKIPEAEVYFIYDFGFPEQIRILMNQLSDLNRPMIVVARGLTTRSIIDHIHPWLSQIFKPIHKETYSIYSNFRNL